MNRNRKKNSVASGVEDLVKIDEIINAERHCQIFIHYASPSGKHLIGSGLI